VPTGDSAGLFDHLVGTAEQHTLRRDCPSELSGAPPSTAITGITACCARATTGHAAVVAIAVMNSRRLMTAPTDRIVRFKRVF